MMSAKPMGSVRADAISITEDVISSGKDFNLIFVHNEDMCAGVVSVLEENDLLGKVSVVTLNGSPDGIQMIKDGKVLATCANPPSYVGGDVVGQIILDPKCTTPKNELVDYFCKKYKLDAVKFYQEFPLGEITSKRDFQFLAQDYTGYASPCDEHHHYLVDYSKDGNVVRRKAGIIHYQY